MLYPKVLSPTNTSFVYDKTVQQLVATVMSQNYTFVGSCYVSASIFNIKQIEPVFCFTFATNPAQTKIKDRSYIYIPTDQLQSVKEKLLSYEVINSKTRVTQTVYPDKQTLLNHSIDRYHFNYKVEIDTNYQLPLFVAGYDSLSQYSHPLYPSLFFTGKTAILQNKEIIFEYVEVGDWFQTEGERYVSLIRPKGVDSFLPEGLLNFDYIESVYDKEHTCAELCCFLKESQYLIEHVTKEIPVVSGFEEGVATPNTCHCSSEVDQSVLIVNGVQYTSDVLIYTLDETLSALPNVDYFPNADKVVLSWYQNEVETLFPPISFNLVNYQNTTHLISWADGSFDLIEGDNITVTSFEENVGNALYIYQAPVLYTNTVTGQQIDSQFVLYSRSIHLDPTVEVKGDTIYVIATVKAVPFLETVYPNHFLISDSNDPTDVDTVVGVGSFFTSPDDISDWTVTVGDVTSNVYVGVSIVKSVSYTVTTDLDSITKDVSVAPEVTSLYSTISVFDSTGELGTYYYSQLGGDVQVSSYTAQYENDRCLTYVQNKNTVDVLLDDVVISTQQLTDYTEHSSFDVAVDSFPFTSEVYSVPSGGKVDFAISSYQLEFAADQFHFTVDSVFGPRSDHLVLDWADFDTEQIQGAEHIEETFVKGGWWVMYQHVLADCTKQSVIARLMSNGTLIPHVIKNDAVSYPPISFDDIDWDDESLDLNDVDINSYYSSFSSSVSNKCGTTGYTKLIERNGVLITTIDVAYDFGITLFKPQFQFIARAYTEITSDSNYTASKWISASNQVGSDFSNVGVPLPQSPAVSVSNIQLPTSYNLSLFEDDVLLGSTSFVEAPVNAAVTLYEPHLSVTYQCVDYDKLTVTEEKMIPLEESVQPVFLGKADSGVNYGQGYQYSELFSGNQKIGTFVGPIRYVQSGLVGTVYDSSGVIGKLNLGKEVLIESVTPEHDVTYFPSASRVSVSGLTENVETANNFSYTLVVNPDNSKSVQMYDSDGLVGTYSIEHLLQYENVFTAEPDVEYCSGDDAAKLSWLGGEYQTYLTPIRYSVTPADLPSTDWILDIYHNDVVIHSVTLNQEPINVTVGCYNYNLNSLLISHFNLVQQDVYYRVYDRDPNKQQLTDIVKYNTEYYRYCFQSVLSQLPHLIEREFVGSFTGHFVTVSDLYFFRFLREDGTSFITTHYPLVGSNSFYHFNDKQVLRLSSDPVHEVYSYEETSVVDDLDITETSVFADQATIIDYVNSGSVAKEENSSPRLLSTDGLMQVGEIPSEEIRGVVAFDLNDIRTDYDPTDTYTLQFEVHKLGGLYISNSRPFDGDILVYVYEATNSLVAEAFDVSATDYNTLFNTTDLYECQTVSVDVTQAVADLIDSDYIGFRLEDQRDNLGACDVNSCAAITFSNARLLKLNDNSDSQSVITSNYSLRLS